MIFLDTLRYAVSFLSIILYFTHYLEIRRRRLNQNRKFVQNTKRDSFTGLYNKTFFSRTIQKWIDKGEEFYLFILNIDDFENIHRRYGHAVRNGVILHLSDHLEETCPSETMISRFREDEFVFAQRNTNEEKFAPWLNQLQDLNYQVDEETSIRFTVSIGICKSSNYTKYEKIHHKADECLYISKKLGKGHYTLHSSNMTDDNI